MAVTELVRERDCIAAFIPPQTINNATAYSQVIDMSLYNRVEATLSIGTGATGTINLAAYQSDNANGAGNTAITGAAITAIVNGTNQVATLEVQAPTLSKRYVVFAMIESQVIAKIAGVTVRGTDARYMPANTGDNTAVVQRVSA